MPGPSAEGTDFALRCLLFFAFRRSRDGSVRVRSDCGSSLSAGNENCGDLGEGLCTGVSFGMGGIVRSDDDLAGEAALEARRLRHSLPGPEYRESPMNFSSAAKFRVVDRIIIPIALRKRRGNMVKQESQASKQTKNPNHKTPSSSRGTLRKFCRRSILTLDDS